MTDDKNQLALLRIWERIMEIKSLKDWNLKIVGNGENHDILNDYIIEKKIKNIKILEPIKDVEKIYSSSSVYVSTSRSEGYPMVLVEAVSFGLPTIAFDCPTGPDEILNNDSGVLIKLGDEDGFVNKLSELMSDLGLREKFSENAYVRSNNWGEEEIMIKWNKVFNK